ncbi:MAG: NADH-quinone oxidoreductase subunit H [Anaerolineae bacterium]|nr:NADH-quinone oxidoreductase subunit H [Anaerolineae bacterium]
MLDLIKSCFSFLIFPGFAFLFVCALTIEWLDRKMTARFQGRVGPPWFQPLADWIKLMGKEDILPVGASERVCAALPIVSLAATLTAMMYVPVAGQAVSAFEGDLVVVLFLLSVPTLAYFLAGWASVGVYSLLGGNRSLLQYLAYEVPFLMALSGPAILSGSWSISQIAERQMQTVWSVLTLPVGFAVAVIGLIGKLKRVPFDIPKAKSEVVAGPLTEFSGRKLALWQLAIGMQTVVGVFLLVNVFVGGSRMSISLPVVPVFALKVLLFVLLLSTISALYARLRIDQLADLGWRVLAPLALAQIVVTIWIAP